MFVVKTGRLSINSKTVNIIHTLMLSVLLYALFQVRKGVDVERWERVMEWTLYLGLAYHVVSYITGYSLHRLPIRVPTDVSTHPHHMIDDVENAIRNAEEEEEELEVENEEREKVMVDRNGNVVAVPM